MYPRYAQFPHEVPGMRHSTVTCLSVNHIGVFVFRYQEIWRRARLYVDDVLIGTLHNANRRNMIIVAHINRTSSVRKKANVIKCIVREQVTAVVQATNKYIFSPRVPALSVSRECMRAWVGAFVRAFVRITRWSSGCPFYLDRTKWQVWPLGGQLQIYFIFYFISYAR